MEPAIQISAINDFLFCPKSLYLHSIYQSFETSKYHDTPQVAGSLAHKNIEEGSYTTAKHILQATTVYSSRLGVKGKIDTYDIKTKTLTERKYKVKQVYLGYVYQLYAQMYCLEEAGFFVKNLCIQSLSDNKRYQIDLPSKVDKIAFEKLISEMNSFNIDDLSQHSCSQCDNNIYSLLNW